MRISDQAARQSVGAASPAGLGAVSTALKRAALSSHTFALSDALASAWAVWRRPTLLQTAIEADRRLDLDERLTSSLDAGPIDPLLPALSLAGAGALSLLATWLPARAAAARGWDDLIRATADALTTFTPKHCTNFFRHAQYATT